MNVLFKLISIAEQFFILYTYIVFITQTYQNKKFDLFNKGYLSCFCLLTSISICLLKTDLSFLVYIICIIPLYILYRYILECSNNYTIVNIVVLYLCISLSDMMAYFIIKLSTNISFFESYINQNNFYIFNLIKCGIFASIIFILVYFIKKNREQIVKNFDYLTNKELAIFLLLSFSIVIPDILKYTSNMDFYNLNLLGINIARLTIVITLIALYFKYIIFCRISNSELKQTQIYNRTLNELIDKLNILKHDYNNILQSINGYIVTKQYDLLEEHINNLIKESKKISTAETINPNIINHPAIYGVVGSKYLYAMDKNIKFNLNVLTNISEISFDFSDLSRILGILLDNAIEATQKSKTPQVSLKFSYNKNKQADMIEIKNSMSPDIKIDTTKIFNKGVSSKKVKSGIGLWEVKKIISSKSNSQIYASVDNNEFSQTIIIEKAQQK